jgi:hypothetical protein
MAEADKLNIDSIIQRLLEGKGICVCSLISIFGAISPAACGALITMTMATIRRQTTEEPIRAVRGRR